MPRGEKPGARMQRAALRVVAGLVTWPDEVALSLAVGAPRDWTSLVADPWLRRVAVVVTTNHIPRKDGLLDLAEVNAAVRRSGYGGSKGLADLAALIDEAPLPTEVERDWLPALVDEAQRIAVARAATDVAAEALGQITPADGQRRVDQLRTMLADAEPLLCAADVTPRRVDWLWYGRIPLGKLTLLAGIPGCGKTTIALEIAARVTRGRGMYDDDEPEPIRGDVLVISAEDDPEDTLVPRLDAAGADRMRVRLWPRERALPSLPDGIATLDREIERHRIRLLVLDPASCLLSAATDSHRDADVRRALAPLCSMAQRRQCAVLGITHTSKSGAAGTPGAALSRVLGSVAWGAAARSVLIAGPDEDDLDEAKLAVAKCNLAPRAPTLRLRRRIDPTLGAVCMEWVGRSSTDADEMVSPPQRGQEPADSHAGRAWLRGQLAGGPRTVRPLRADGEALGYTWRSIQRWASDLGVVGQGAKGSSEYSWRLP